MHDGCICDRQDNTNAFRAVVAGLLRMIPWIQIHIQDITHPTVKLLDTTFPTEDQQGRKKSRAGFCHPTNSYLTGIVSIAIFWTYIEIGVGFIVACVPRSAWVLDKISIEPILSNLRSLSSSVSLLRKDRNSRRKEKEMSGYQSSLATMPQPKKSSGNRSDDDVELIAVGGHV